MHHDRLTMVEPETGRTCMVMERDREVFEKRGYRVEAEATALSEAELADDAPAAEEAPPEGGSGGDEERLAEPSAEGDGGEPQDEGSPEDAPSPAVKPARRRQRSR